MVTLHDGDVIVGVLGHRNALQGYSGVVPDAVALGQRLQLLNLGGVIGQCTSANIERGPALGRRDSRRGADVSRFRQPCAACRRTSA